MPKFTLKSATIISSWKYSKPINNDCTICRCNINQDSIYNQDVCIESKILYGACGHAFHEECINPWLSKNNRCPICSAKWALSLI